MAPRQSSTNPLRTTTRALVWAVLCVLCLGLHRTFVVCNGPHCDARVEIAHGRGGCDGHDEAHGGEALAHESAAGARDRDAGGERCEPDPHHCACSDRALALDEGPLPKSVQIHLGSDAPAATTGAEGAFPPPPDVPDRKPPSTEPPRPDARTALRASTVLLL
jgi:hypothetical protein